MTSIQKIIRESKFYQQIGEFEKSLDIASKTIIEGQKANIYTGLLDLLVIKAYALQKLGRIPELYETVIEGVKVLQNIQDKNLNEKEYVIAEFNELKGIYFFQIGDMDIAFHCLFDALVIREEQGDLEKLGQSYNNLGKLYFQIGNLEQALEYQKKYLAISEKLDSKIDISTSHTNIGNIYEKQGN